ncbi:hypothetical protein Tco_1392688 [Tanacetum coccineum]
MPLGDHAAHWSSYIGEVIRGWPLYYPSWLTVSEGAKPSLYLRAAHGIPRLDRDQRGHPAALAKGGHVLRTLRRKSGKSISSFGMILGTLPEPLKISKTGQRARGRAQALRSTRRSLTPSSCHTLLTGNSFGTRTDFESGGASGSGGCGDEVESAEAREDEDEDGDGDVGPTVSLGIVAGEGIPVELSPTNIPQRQVTRETYPQRHVARESTEFSPGKVYNVVVPSDGLRPSCTLLLKKKKDM